jgi:quinol monooxygenase YgiN
VGLEKETRVSEHLIFVDTFRVKPGRLEEFRQMAAEICGAVADEEPQVIEYSIHLSADRMHGVGTQVHADYESVQHHGRLMRRFAERIMELTEIVSQDIYGPLPPAHLAAIRATTGTYGDVEVRAFDRCGGFVRATR